MPRTVGWFDQYSRFIIINRLIDVTRAIGELNWHERQLKLTYIITSQMIRDAQTIPEVRRLEPVPDATEKALFIPRQRSSGKRVQPAAERVGTQSEDMDRLLP
jgi:hypothetical protein